MESSRPRVHLSLSVLRRGGFEDIDIASLDVDGVRLEIERGEAWELTVHPVEEFPQCPRMHIDYTRGGGFVVMAFEDERSIGYYAMAGTTCSKPEVPIELGGQALEKWPRELFVQRHIAARALQTFLRTGRQDESFTWVANDAFDREVIWEDLAGRIAWEKQQGK